MDRAELGIRCLADGGGDLGTREGEEAFRPLESDGGGADDDARPVAALRWRVT